MVDRGSFVEVGDEDWAGDKGAVFLKSQFAERVHALCPEFFLGELGASACGQEHGIDQLFEVAAGQADGKPDRSLVAPIVGELEPGKYTASWKTSGNDGHILNGTFEFTVATKK